MLKPIEVFKAGKHRATNGKDYEFTAAQVAEIVASYDPAVQAAPIVLGHPKTDDPAWGWAEGLTLNDAGVIVAQPEKVDPAFAEGVEAGRYRYVSAALYPPDDAHNPKPGQWYLRHIGFLGAQPPAVKGLQPAFSEAPGDDVVAFAAADAATVQSLFRGLRDWIIDDKGVEVADRVLPSWYLDSLEVYEPSTTFAEGGETLAASGAETTVAGGLAADTITGGEVDDALAPAFAERTAQLDARETEIRTREVAFAQARRAEERAEDTTFLDGLVDAGRLPPGHRDRVATLMARLGGDAEVAFAEADADPRVEMRTLLEGLGQSIQFSEFSGRDGLDLSAEGAAPAIAAEITRIVSEAKARGETLSYSAAAAMVGR